MRYISVGRQDSNKKVERKVIRETRMQNPFERNFNVVGVSELHSVT